MLWRLSLILGFVEVAIAVHGFVGMVSKRQPGKHEAAGRAKRKPMFSAGALHNGARAGMLSVQQLLRQLNRERLMAQVKIQARTEARMMAMADRWFATH